MSVNTIDIIGRILLTILLCSGVTTVAAQTADEPQWLRDPFRYQTHNSQENETVKAEPVSDKGLKGIFVSNGRYRALYNGQMVTTGQRVGSVLIRDISPYSIIIEDNAGRRRIELFHEK